MSIAASRKATITLPTDDQILITREFDGSRAAVYRAYTTPELVRRWWCGQRGEMTLCDIDLRVGGRWRYVMRANGGFEVAFHGVYQDIVPNERIVSTEVFEAKPDAEASSTVTFTESDGRTLLTMLIQHANQADRDAHIQSGMEGGLNESLALLDQITA